MEKPLLYRDYQPGDEHQILSLFKLAFREEMSYAFWRWRFMDNPFGKGIIKLAFDGDILVGHASVIPMRVQFQGGLLPAIFPMTAMTHPDYGGRGIHSRLLASVYDAAREQGFVFAYGFFNDNVLNICIRLGYKGITKMNVMEKKLDIASIVKSSGKNIVELQVFDDRIERLWDWVKQGYNIIVPRDRAFLNWRFVRYSEIDYPKFVFQDGNGDILGYIVLKVYVEGSLVRGHIIDLLSIPGAKVIKPLISKALEYFADEGISDVSCWIMENSIYAPYLTAEGFEKRSGATNYGAKLLNESDNEHRAVENSAIWHLTMGDSDVF